MSSLRVLVVAVASLLVTAAPAAAAPLDLERVTVAQLQDKIVAGELTSVELTKAYIDRIAALNNRGPGMNAVRMLNPDALNDAALLDLERRKGTTRGLLHGIPVLVKDNLDVAGLPTTAAPSRSSTRSRPRTRRSLRGCARPAP